MNTAIATPPVKVSWGKQEMIFVTAVFLLLTGSYLWEAFTISAQQIYEQYEQVYRTNELSPGSRTLNFYYNSNVLAPRLFMALLLYTSYFLINRIRIISLTAPLWLFLIDVGLSFGVAIATDMAHPWLFNYGGFGLLALFGYMPNLYVAFTRAFVLTGLYASYVVIRDWLTDYIQRTGHRNAYRILVTNQVTGMLFIYFFVLWLLNFFNLVTAPFFATTYFSFVTAVLLMYLVNMYWLFPKYEGQKELLNRRYIFHLLVTSFVCSLPFMLSMAFQAAPSLFLLYWAAQLLVVTPLTWLVYQQQKDKILQLRSMERALSRSTTDLQLLRSQINPHFLFNTLNTLYGTALQEGAQRTAEGIQRLGDMMRFMLHENQLVQIPLQREIEYLDNYVALQKLRTQSSPNIRIESVIESSQCSHSIAPMLLIPLVENAFKHGISLIEPSWIKIKLECDEKAIHFSIANSIHTQQQKEPVWESPGIGIANVTERLKLIYPGKHQIQFNNDGNEFHVQLTIRL